MPTIYLSPSTQEFNPYVTSGNEEFWMNKIADAMMPYLKSSGIRVIRNTPEMTAATSITQSNQSNVDLHVALHSNAGGGQFAGILRGSEAYYEPGNPDSERFADIVVKNLKMIYPVPDDVSAIPTDFLGEVLRTFAPAVLIEFAYHDNVQDANWITSNIEEIAKNVVLSITQYFGIPFVQAQSERIGVVNLQNGNLNIRSRPTTEASILGKIPNNTKISVLGITNGWYVVQYNDIIGYVDGQFVRLN